MNRRLGSLLARYGLAVGLTLIFACLVQIPEIGRGFVSLIFLVVFLSARFGGRGPSLFATATLTLLAILSMTRDGRHVENWQLVQIALLMASGPLITSVVESMSQARRAAEDQAHEAARQSERLRTTLHSIGDAVIVTDLEGSVVSLNPAAEILTGWTQPPAEGRPLSEIFQIIGSQTRQPLESPLKSALLEGKTVVPADHSLLVSRDGIERPIDNSAAPIRGKQGQVEGVVLVFRDVSTRRNSERQLAAAEARFRAFMDHSPVVAFLKDEDGRYLWGNATWSKQHESRDREIIGKTDFELWPDETAALFRKSDRVALGSNSKVEFNESTHHADGSSTHWMTLKFPVSEADGRTLIGGIAVDVTHRTLAEQSMRESEARYRFLFDSNPHPMWVFDVESLAFLAVNEAAVQRYGYSRDEFLAMTIDQIRPAEDLDRLHQWIAQQRQAALLVESHWRHRKKNGSIISVEIASHSLQFEGRPARVVLAHDVTERIRAEEALRIHRERLDLVINGAELGLWYCDLPGAALTLNDRAKSHFGIQPGDFLNLTSSIERVHSEDRERTRSAINRALEFREPFDVEHRVSIDEQRSRWIRMIGRAFFDESNTALRFDGISIDVTERKLAEEELRQAKESAVVANHAKSKFLAMIGHELRTPLTPVLAAVSALLDDSRQNCPPDQGWSKQELRDLLMMIRRNIELETRLIGDLLDISRVERGELRLEVEVVDLHEAIRQAVDICRYAVLISGIDLRLELSATHHEVRGDHARLMQIVWNLVHNAAKFAPNGHLTIRTFEIDPDPTNPLFHRVAAEFHDDGAGFEPEFMSRIFDPFEQADMPSRSRLSGLGLGLAISRSIAEAHGGTLTATSQGRGRGSTFRLELDAQTSNQPRVASRTAPGPIDRSDSGRILVVEDNADTLRYLAIVLRQREYHVETARHLDQAKALVASSTFDVLISDIELPDGSGLELMTQMRGKVVGIAMSGFGSDTDVEVSLAAGFSTHLTKPIDINRLNVAIRQAMARSAR